jgi:class 3 adenylate cyclase
MGQTVNLRPIFHQIEGQCDDRINIILEKARGNLSSAVLSKVLEEFELELTQKVDSCVSVGNTIEEIESELNSTLQRALSLLTDQFCRRNLSESAAHKNERKHWENGLEGTRDALIEKCKISQSNDTVTIKASNPIKKTSQKDEQPEQPHTFHPRGIISASVFNDFSHSLLGIGDLNIPSKRVNALVAILDLQDFTAFSQQEDPELAVQPFLNELVVWFFKKLKELALIEQKNQLVYCHIPLPIYAKFLGDGFMLIWDLNLESIQQKCKETGHNWEIETQRYIGNILNILFDIKNLYKNELAKKLRLEYRKVPKKLRCGVARGSIYSIGGGKDYVGPCINKAARLANYPPLSMLVSTKGISIERSSSEKLTKFFVRATMDLKGIGKEYVYINRYEYGHLPEKEKELIKKHKKK